MQYKIIGWFAMVFTPIAPSSFFGWRVYTVVDEMTSGLWWLSFGSALAAVIGLEAVGILAGHTAIDAIRLKKYEAGAFAAVVLIAYVVIGVYELWNTIGAIIFLIAPLAYLAVGLREALSEVSHEKKQDTAAKYKARQAQLDAQKEIKLAEIEAKKQASIERAKAASFTRQDARQDAAQVATYPADWRQLSAAQKAQLANMPRGEREKHMQDLAARTRRAWHDRLDKLQTTED